MSYSSQAMGGHGFNVRVYLQNCIPKPEDMMKESKKRSQRRRVFKILKKYPQTTKMIQLNTGIPRENITRHISELEKRKKITVVKKAPCQITNHTAKYYSSEQKYFTPETQPELFPTTNAGPYAL